MLFETVDSLGSLEAAKVPLFHAVSFVKFSFLFQNQGVSNHETYLTCLDYQALISGTHCDLVTIFQRSFFNLLHKIIQFSDIMQFSNIFCGAETKSVTKSRLHCICFTSKQ